MSILGTLGPLVQGSRSYNNGIRTAMAFGVAFLIGAVAVFGLVGAAGVALGSGHLPRQWRLGIAGASLLALTTLDLLAIRRSTYCPIGWRRQTPKSLLRGRRLAVVAAAWGLDTGLAVTTFRVGAITWGALLLAALGLSPSWSGLAYALGFNLPFILLLWRHRVGPCSRSTTPADPGLASMLAKRALLQGLSAVLLAAGGGVLIAGLLV